ncbi:hypothetical protein K493DRAFT_359883 [Basidiobolus meristosporus CBS 931.73]|uniref:CRIB domain-containing protein n=1 Tax=Basidiobolus meristosporus CBS 931.73 TaxID=1314790 RepID=A0A1Y1XNU3_9FUNG|nr:hypothetical protein K493DRAFT_359883 [Basidiobolus meristosporus CBS 931.73]|eukprot:ORX87430.1 hypothetical protein K493DRAFT_359883 [Basidiobolus meristosporus CBS 931.73]
MCNCFGVDDDDVLLTERPYNQAPRPNDKRPRRKIDKSAIGKPSNFQHTGHIGIGEIRNGIVDRVDPEKIKKQMAEIAAVLNFDDTAGHSTNLTPTNKASEAKMSRSMDQAAEKDKSRQEMALSKDPSDYQTTT